MIFDICRTLDWPQGGRREAAILGDVAPDATPFSESAAATPLRLWRPHGTFNKFNERFFAVKASVMMYFFPILVPPLAVSTVLH